MNVADAEVVLGILEDQGYKRTLDKEDADIWLLLTCSIRFSDQFTVKQSKQINIREGAEDKIWRKLHHIETSRQRRRLKKELVVGHYYRSVSLSKINPYNQKLILPGGSVGVHG